MNENLNNVLKFVYRISGYEQVGIGLNDGLLPDGTKPLLEPILTNHQ